MNLSKMYARAKASAERHIRRRDETRQDGVSSPRARAALLLVCAGILMLAACKNNGPTITIQILPATSESVDEGQSFNFTATLGGDTNNKGVTWSIPTSNNTTCSGTGCGTISNATPFSVTYTAPSNLGASESVTLQAAANANTSETATADITVELPPTFTTTALAQCAVNVFCLPGGSNGVPYNQTIMASGGIGTLIFSAPANSLPKGLTLNTTGNIVGTPSLPTVGQQPITTTFPVTVMDSPTFGTPASVVQSFSITINPPTLLSITTNSPLAAGFVNANYNAPMSASGGVTPFTWTISSGSLPPGLSINSGSGQITGVPTLQAVTYPKTYSFTVQLQDSSLPSQIKTQSFSITIQNPGPPQISSTLLPQGTTGTPYTPTSLSVTGGVPPFTWAVVGGQLPAGLSLSSSGIISGTPIVATSPPSESFFQVQVTDSEATPVTAGPQTFGITVAGGTSNNSLIHGEYTFLFNGFDVNGPLAIAGTLTTDGNGNITTGSEDINRASPANTTPSPTLLQNASITGTYALDNTGDGRGTMELIVTNPSTSVTLTTDYRIVIDSTGNIHSFESPVPSPPVAGFDTFSTHGQGVMKPIPGSTVSGFTGFQSSSFTGNYAFEFSGTDTSGKPAALAGEFHADGSSTISQGTGDFNDAGTFSALPFTISGSLSMGATGVRGAAQLVFAPTGKPQVEINFAYYFVSPSDMFFIELDQTQTPQQTAFYRLSGEAIFQQSGVHFVNSTLTGGNVITGSGLNSSNSNADAFAGLISSASGNGSATLIYDENNGGTVSGATAPVAGTYSVSSSGRVSFSFPGWTGHPTAVAYLYGPGQGFLLGGDSTVSTGLIEHQSSGPTFSAASVQGSYALSNALTPDSKAPNVVGQANSDGADNISGFVDEVDASLTAHTGQSLAGSFINSLSATTGRGTVTFNPLSGFPTTAAFYVVSPESVRFVSTDSGSLHPELIFFDH